MTTAFRLTKAKHPWTHWGDHGDILVHGMTNHLPRKDGLLQLERTGPFMPKLFFPGIADVVLTDQAKIELSSRIPRLTFQPVRKTLLVRLNWHEWPQTNSEPLTYPESGEPEDYILGQPHDPVLVEDFGPIWELSAEIDHEIQGTGGSFRSRRYRGQHLVRANIMGGYNFVSPELQAALLAVAPGEVELRPVQEDHDA